MPRHLDPIASRAFTASRLGRASRLLPALLSGLLAASCVTVNIYFPAPEVREAAEQIVDETWGSAPTPPPAPGKQSALAPRFLMAALEIISPCEAAAADVDVNVSTAAIRALKDGMKQRASELKPFLSSGGVGIGRDGLLVERGAASVDLATKAKVRRLVDAENKDRESLYREIATANKFGAERVADIRSIFAQTWKDKAEPGWWIQAADGSWKKK